MSARREAIFLFGLLGGALVLRLFVSIMAFHGPFDTTTVGVMALDILEGERPLFYYGQNYMGTMEAYVAAVAFALFGRSLLTLSLAPIFFSLLWLVATWWLIRRLYGARPALVAVAVLAAPGWHSLWFQVAAYGGYPGAFFLGTVALALAVECWMAQPRGARLALCIAGIGFFSGLALWTNFLSSPWLAMAAGACLPLAWSRRSDPWLWFGVAAGMVLLLAGASPILLRLDMYGGDPVSGWTLHRWLLRLRWDDFLRPGLCTIAFAPTATPSWWQAAVAATLVVAGLAYAATLARAGSWLRRGGLLLPCVFMFVYLALSLPHHLAGTRAFRYLIPLWSALCITFFALPCGAKTLLVRRAAMAAGMLFCLLQTGESIAKALRDANFKRDTIEARDRLAMASAALGHPPVYVVGNRILGYRAMNYNFWSGGNSRFASIFDDRNRRVAERVESGRHHLLATAPQYAERVENALQDLGVAFTRTDGGPLILYDPQPTGRTAGPSLYPLKTFLERSDGTQVPAPALADRVWETGYEDHYASATAIRIELPSVTEIDSIVLQTTDPYQDGLPALFRVTALDAGGEETWSRTSGPRFTSAYVEDGRVFMKGYFGQLESRLGGVRAAAIRIEPLAGAGELEQWSIHEVYVFPVQPKSEVDLDEAMEAMIRNLHAHSDSFIMAPRALSAWVNDAFPDRDPPPAYRRYNPRFADTLRSRFFEPGMTVVASEKYAPEIRRLIANAYPEIQCEEHPLPPWQVFRTRPGTAAHGQVCLIWNGHLLLQTLEPEPAWHTP